MEVGLGLGQEKGRLLGPMQETVVERWSDTEVEEEF